MEAGCKQENSLTSTKHIYLNRGVYMVYQRGQLLRTFLLLSILDMCQEEKSQLGTVLGILDISKYLLEEFIGHL